MVPWTRRELVAERFATRRIFLVGDAAHQLSPTGGFGMNTGIQEAVDLAWKLAARVEGWGGPGLIASYEIERKPVAVRNVREAAANLQRMLSTRTTPPPKQIFAPGPAGDAARKSYGDRYTETMREEWFTLGIQLGYRYDGSPIIVPDGTAPPSDDKAAYIQTARPGHRAPHVRLADGRSTLDLFGKGFTLLRLGGKAVDVAALASAAAERKRPAPRLGSGTNRPWWPPTSAGWCWCAPTAMSPGAPTIHRTMPCN